MCCCYHFYTETDKGAKLGRGEPSFFNAQMEAVGDIENSANEMNGIENSESDNNKDSSEGGGGGDGGGSSVGGIAPPDAGTGDQAGAAATALQNEITEAAVSGKRHVILGGLCFARIYVHTYIFIIYLQCTHPVFTIMKTMRLYLL